MFDSPARGSAHKHEGDIDLELTAIPYTIKLDLECDGYCHGSLVRLPDGVEASFNHMEGLLVLLEGIGGRRCAEWPIINLQRGLRTIQSEHRRILVLAAFI